MIGDVRQVDTITGGGSGGGCMYVMRQQVQRPVSYGHGWEWCWAEVWVANGRVAFISYFN